MPENRKTLNKIKEYWANNNLLVYYVALLFGATILVTMIDGAFVKRPKKSHAEISSDTVNQQNIINMRDTINGRSR